MQNPHWRTQAHSLGGGSEVWSRGCSLLDVVTGSAVTWAWLV